MKHGAHWKSSSTGFVLLLTLISGECGQILGGNTLTSLLRMTTPRRTHNTRYFLNQTMLELVWAARPASWIPDHSQILRACWGRSAGRFSQGDPSPSLLQPVGSILTHPEVPLARSNQPEPEPNSHPQHTSTLTTSTSSSHAIEMNPEDDHV